MVSVILVRHSMRWRLVGPKHVGQAVTVSDDVVDIADLLSHKLVQFFLE